MGEKLRAGVGSERRIRGEWTRAHGAREQAVDQHLRSFSRIPGETIRTNIERRLEVVDCL